jgi:hypothetical protein
MPLSVSIGQRRHRGVLWRPYGSSNGAVQRLLRQALGSHQPPVAYPHSPALGARAVHPQHATRAVEFEHRIAAFMEGTNQPRRFGIEHPASDPKRRVQFGEQRVEYGDIGRLIRPEPKPALQRQGNAFARFRAQSGLAMKKHPARPQEFLEVGIAAHLVVGPNIVIDAKAVPKRMLRVKPQSAGRRRAGHRFRLRLGPAGRAEVSQGMAAPDTHQRGAAGFGGVSETL